MTLEARPTDARGGDRRLAERERKRAVTTAAVGLVFALSAVAFYWREFPFGRVLDLPLQGFGVVWIVTGYLAWTRLPGSRIGLIIVCLGVTYYLQDLRASPDIVVFGIGYCLAFLWMAVGAHLILAYPEGQVKGRPSRLLLTCCYASVVISQLARMIADHPVPPIGYDKSYKPTPASVTGSVLAIVLIIALAVVIVRRWRRASAVGRRSRTPVWAAIMLVAIPGSTACLVSIFHFQNSLDVQNDLTSVALGIAVLLLSAILTLQSTNARRALLRLMEVLGPVQVESLKRHPEALQQMLAAAVGDPSLTVAYPVGNEQYVNIEGQPVSPAFKTDGRTITRVKQGDDVVAVIEHDEAVGDQHRVTEIVAQVAGVAIDIAMTHAKLRGKIKEIDRSRLRISEAALEERSRIEHDLHDGAQQRFLAVLALLGLAQENLSGNQGDGNKIGSAQDLVVRAHGQLQEAIEELRKLAQGIYPTSLSEAGLAAAINDIADISPVPIWVEIPRTRWGKGAETTSYFLIAEAIANATKHAKATHIEVRAHEQDEHIHIEVLDDGLGGMDAAPKGLADRVSTIGGRLTFRSPPGTGTVIQAVLPL